MRAGMLRDRITIQQATNATSDSGGVSKTWSTFKQRWATAEPMGGRESFRADERHGEADWKFTLRYTAGITKAMRVSWDSRTFDITSVQHVRHPKAGDRMTIIQAVEDD